jgi:magnesium-transporting ATPase (P-type)
MHNLHKELLETKRIIYFITLSIILIILTYIIQATFYNEQVFYNTYLQQLSLDRVKKIYEASNKWQLVSLLFLPAALLIKIFYNSFWITACSILNNERGGFKGNYNICLKAEYVFVLMLLVKFICLLLFKQVDTLNDLSFIPGSVINLYSVDKIPKWLIYPLQTWKDIQ